MAEASWNCIIFDIFGEFSKSDRALFIVRDKRHYFRRPPNSTQDCQ